MKYKNKPVVVEAVRFNGLTEPMFSERPDWLEEQINAGDYIVKEADGINLYSPDEFKETYAAMNDVTN